MEELRFVVLLEEMKKIYRQTKIIGEDRKENDAEHSFHVASMAIFLEELSNIKVDVNRVVKMLLIHDYVEIFAGDTYAYNEDRKKGQFQREKAAMDKLKEYLSEKNGELLESLWLEFEERQTNEAKFAVAMDRLQPIMSNLYRNDGGTWKANQVKISQVHERIKPIKDFNESIHSYVKEELVKAVEKGFLIDDIGLGGNDE